MGTKVRMTATRRGQENSSLREQERATQCLVGESTVA